MHPTPVSTDHQAELRAAIRQILAEELAQPIEQISDEQVEHYLALLQTAPDEELEPVCLHTLFEQQASQNPNAVALLGLHADGAAASVLTFHELNQQANQLAHSLQQLGVQPEMPVGILLERSTELVVSMLGVLKAGAAYVLLDPSWPQAYLATVLAHLPALWLITRQHLLPQVPTPPQAVLCIDAADRALPQEWNDNPVTAVTAMHLACIHITAEHAVAIEHQGLCQHLGWLQEHYPLTGDDRVLWHGPLTLAGVAWDLLWALTAGSSLFLANLPQPLDPVLLPTLIERHGITALQLTPTQLSQILSNTQPQLESLRQVFCCGEPLHQTTVENFQQQSIAQLVYLYAPAEAAGAVTAELCMVGSDRPIVAAGHPVAAWSLYVLDRHLQPAPPGVVGDIYVSGPGLARGYIADDLATRQRFRSNPFSGQAQPRLFKTGDQGRLLPDGRLELVAETEQRSWIGGVAVPLGLIEAALYRHPALRDCAVLVRDTSSAGPCLVAYIVAASTVGPAELREHIQALLPAELQPSVYVPISTLPLTPTGQLDRLALSRLPVIDDQVMTEWEQQLRAAMGGVEVAVLAQPASERAATLHISELLPDWRSPRISPHNPALNAPTPTQVTAQTVLAISAGEPLTATDLPTSLAQLLERAAHEAAEQGILYLTADGTPQAQFYPTLLEDAQRIHAGLRELGLQAGQPVLIQLTHNQDYLTAFWGCVLGGYIPALPGMLSSFDPDDSAVQDVLHAWKQLEQPLLITHAALEAPFQALSTAHAEGGLRSVAIEKLMQHTPAPHSYPAQADDPALLLFSPAQSGTAEAISLSHRVIISHLAAIVQANGFSSHDISLNWLPLDQASSLIDIHLKDIFLGALQIHAPTAAVLHNPLQWLDWATLYAATSSCAPAFVLRLIVEQAATLWERRWNLAALRLITITGDGLVAGTARHFLTLLAPYGLPPAALRPAFGLPATAGGISYAPPFSLDTVSDDHAPIELGTPIPGVQLRIVDWQHNIVPEGVVGELQVLSGSAGQTSSQQANFSAEGWLSTSYLGTLRHQRLNLLGHADDVLLINGASYAPTQIEAVLEALDGVAPTHTAACAIQRGQRGHDQLVIFFAPNFNDELQLITLLRTMAARLMAQFGLTPAYIIPVDQQAIPRTSIGTIDRAQLRRLFANGHFDATIKRIDLLLANSNTLPAGFYRKSWRRRERPSLAAPPLGDTLIFLDPAGLGQSCAALLSESPCRVATVVPQSGFAQLGPGRYAIDPANAADYDQLLAAVYADGLRSYRIIHLWTYNPSASEALNPMLLEQAQTQGSQSLLLLAQALQRQHSHDQEIQVYVVSSGVQPVAPTEPIACAHAPLLGLVHTLPQELPWLHCCHIDLANDPPEVAATQIINELGSAAFNREVAYRNSQRLIPRFQPMDLRASPATDLPFQPGGGYLLIGELDDSNLAIAKFLLQTYAARLLIIGETPLPARETWPQQTGSSAAQLANYLALEQQGGAISYAAIDICDLAALRATVAEACARWQCELAGIIQRSPISAQGWLSATSPSDWSAALRPAIIGTWNLHQVLVAYPSAICISLASAGSLTGRAQPGAEAAASIFLEHFAHLQRTQYGMRSYCYAADVWQSINAGQQLNALLTLLHRDQASAFIALEGSSSDLHYALESPAMLSQQLCAYTDATGVHAASAALPALLIRDRFGTATSCTLIPLQELPRDTQGSIDRTRLPLMDASAQHLQPNNARSQIEQTLLGIWQAVMRNKVSIHDRFFEIGGDSLLAMQVVLKARQAGLSLTLNQLFRHQTIAELAAVVGQRQAIHAEQGLVTGPVPLTPGQRSFFERHITVPDHFNHAYLFEIRTELDLALLEEVFQALVRHHDALRLRFVRSEEGWQQFVAPPESHQLCSSIDLTDVPAAEQEAALEAVAARLHGSLNLASGPLLRAALVRHTPHQPPWLLIIIHHLVVDGASWRILLEDLQTAYSQLERGEPIQLPPKTTSFKYWAERLAAYAQSAEARTDLAYWLAQPWPADASLPLDMPGANSEASARHVSLNLSTATTQALLHESLAAYGVQITDLLLTAMTHALARWSQRRQLVVGVAHHGRQALFDDVDLSRTVGWFSILYPVLLDLGENPDPVAELHTIKQQLARVPKQGFSYMLLRYLSADPEVVASLRAIPHPKVLLTYLGQFDHVLTPTSLLTLIRSSVGPIHHPNGTRLYQLVFNQLIAEDQLGLGLTYSAELHHRTTIEALAHDYFAALNAFTHDHAPA